MPIVSYQTAEVSVQSSQTVLEALESAGFNVPFSCRSGVCHSCLMQADAGAVPLLAQQDLTENQRMQNCFLACCCHPTDDMTVSLLGESQKLSGTVLEKAWLNKRVLKLVIGVQTTWFPGQYLSLWYNEHQGRSYSIASRCDESRQIELHISRHVHGLVSRWLHDEVAVGDTLQLSKPMGNCFYTDDHSGKPMLMASTGTGLAPLYGILLEAYHQGHTAPITLYAAAGEPSALYYVEQLGALAEKMDNFTYIPVVRRASATAAFPVVEADLIDHVVAQHAELSGWKIFLCGNFDMIKKLQRHCFFQGAGVTDILVDVFTVDRPKA